MSPPGPFQLASPSGLTVQVNANASIRRIDLRDVILNAFLGNELEGGPANVYLRRRGRRITWTPLLGPRSPSRVRVGASGLALQGEWSGVRFHLELRLAKAAAAWFWHVRLENLGRAAVTLDLIHAQDVALADYGAVRLNEYYVSQYLDYTPLAHASRGVVLAIRQNLPIGGRHPWALIGSLGRGTSFATDALSFYGLRSRANGARCGSRGEEPARRTSPARALAGRDPGRSRAAGAGRPRRARLLRLARARSPGGERAGRSRLRRARARAARGEPARRARRRRISRAAAGEEPLRFASAPGSARTRPARAREALRHGAPRGRARRRIACSRSSTEATPTSCCRPRSSRACGRTARSCAPGRRWSPTRRRSPRPSGWAASSTRCSRRDTSASTACSRPRTATSGLFRSHGQRIFVELEDGYSLLDTPSAFEMTPNGARWIYRHSGRRAPGAELGPRGLPRDVARRRGPGRSSAALPDREPPGGERRRRIRVRPRARSRAMRGASSWAFCPTPISGGASRTAASASIPRPATRFERVGGDELLFADGHSRGQPFLVLVSAPTRSLGLRMTGRLFGEPPVQVPAPDVRALAGGGCRGGGALLDAHDGPARSAPGRRRSGTPRPRAPGGDPAVVRARRADPLPRAARARAVLGRRLGHARRVPGARRAAARARALRARARPAAARLPQPESGRRLAAVVHVLRARARHPTRRLARRHRLLAAAGARAVSARLGRRGLLDEAVPFFHPEGDARAERATLLAHVERALGADRAARDPGHPPRGLRPRRLERLAPARRPRARRAPVQRLDGHAPSSDAGDAGGGAAARRPQRAGRRARGAAPAASATTSSACSSRTASWPGSRTSARTGSSRTCCTRATARRASATACSR